MNPVSDLFRAVVYPIKAVFVVGLCWFVNTMTSPHAHWWRWAAFGMTIGLIVAWARALKTLVATAGVAGVGYLVYRWWIRRHPTPATASRTFDVR